LTDPDPPGNGGGWQHQRSFRIACFRKNARAGNVDMTFARGVASPLPKEPPDPASAPGAGQSAPGPSKSAAAFDATPANNRHFQDGADGRRRGAFALALPAASGIRSQQAIEKLSWTGQRCFEDPVP